MPFEEKGIQNLEITLKDGLVNYYEYGDKNNPTIVCLHGLAGNGYYSFGELAPRLIESFHIVMLDNPGHGKTAPFQKEDDYLFSRTARWLHCVVEEIVKGPFTILGHSWGADLALHFTRFYPEKVSALVMLDGGFTFPQNQPEMTYDHAYTGWSNYMQKSVFTNEEEIFQEYRTYTNRWNTRKEQYVASLFEKKQDGTYALVASQVTVLAIIEAFFKEPFANAYPFIEVPTLLIYAEHPENLSEARANGILQLQDNIEDITIQAMENSNHMVQWDEPDLTALTITRWLNEKFSFNIN